MVSNIVKKYLGAGLVVICLILALREIALFITPPCLNTLHFTLANQLPPESRQGYLEDKRIPPDVFIKLDSKEGAVDQTLNQPLLFNAVTNQVAYSATFTKHRLKLWYGGRCIDTDEDDVNLVVSHCNPDWEQTFSLTADGKLMYDSSGTCVALNKLNPHTLRLDDCYREGITFKLYNSSYLRTVVGGNTVCLSPVTQTNVQKTTKYSCLNAPIALTACEDEASRLEYMEESFFKKDRIAFVDTSSPSSGSCQFKACGLNVPAKPVEMLRPLYSTRCRRVFDCVTVVTKTARRPYLVLRLAQSIRDKKGYDLRIISYDDGPNDYPEEVWEEMKQFPHLHYIVGDDEDMGISLGRNLALKMVKTKYFLLVDDDHVFNNKTNLDKMVEILDTTDATLVGGKFEGFMKFAGALKFGNYHDRQEFAVFSGYCERELPKFPHCEQCDSTSNIFLAKTQPVIEMGGWSEELKIAEHADFFVKMKAAGNKVVYCDDIEVINQQESPEERSKSYQKLRYDNGRKNRMFRLMNSRYNVNGLFWCSEYEVRSDNELKCLQTKHKIGYC